MSWFGRLWYGTASYAADLPTAPNPYSARLGDVTVQAVKTFNALINTFSKTFDFRHDEALRVDPQFALKMRRDPYLRSLLQERLMPLTRWKWAVKPEDPTNKSEVERAKWYEELIKLTPRFSKQQLYLGHAAWFGRYASQFSLIKDRCQGKACARIGRHQPVNGDKLVFGWDGTPGVRINQAAVGDFPRENITYDNRGGPILMLRDPAHRERFIIHVHELDDADYYEPEMAGRIEGIGLRDFAYYGAYLRSEMIRWAVAFMEKVGTLGMLVFWYPEGNDAARKQAELSAREASNRNAIAIPMPKGADKKSASVDMLPANMSGVQFLVDIIAGWWEKHVERLFVGQSMSAGADDSSGLGGTGRAELAKDTKFNLLQFDATGQQESYTTDLLWVLCDANGDSGWKPRFEYVLPDPEAEAKLTAMTKAATLPGKKLEYKADEVRGLTGMSQPGPDDEVVGGDEPLGPGVGPDGMPLEGAEGLNGIGALKQKQQATDPKPAGTDKEPTPSSGVTQTDDEPDTDSDDRWADPHPESEAFVRAMLAAAEQGDEQALDDLGELANDPDAFNDLVADMEAGPPSPQEAAYFAHLATIPYGWTAGTSRTGGVTAVGNGPHSGKKLYGKRAEAALRAQQRQRKPDEPARSRAPQDQPGPKKRPAAEDKEAARKASESLVAKAVKDPSSLTPTELRGLADHLKTLTVRQLKDFAGRINGSGDGAVAGTKKQELADGILAYVQYQRVTSFLKRDIEKLQNPQKITDVIQSPRAVAALQSLQAVIGDAKQLTAARDEVFAKWRKVRGEFMDRADAHAKSLGLDAYNPDTWQDPRMAALKDEHDRVIRPLSNDWARLGDEVKAKDESVRGVLAAALKPDQPVKLAGSFDPKENGGSAYLYPKGYVPFDASETSDAKWIYDRATEFVQSVTSGIDGIKIAFGKDANGRAWAARRGKHYGVPGGTAGQDYVALISKVPAANPSGPNHSTHGKQVETAIHEIGHVIEFHKPGVEKLANDFLQHRVANEPFVDLASVAPSAFTAGREFGRKDNFAAALGSETSAYYAGKSYSGGSTEIVSMGLEHLYKDPAKFVEADPEYATFLFHILTM